MEEKIEDVTLFAKFKFWFLLNCAICTAIFAY